jgi:hypothetical protein
MTWGQGRGFRQRRRRKCIRFPAAFPAALDLQQPWQRFNTEHELTTKGIEKFVADYRATLYQAAS